MSHHTKAMNFAYGPSILLVLSIILIAAPASASDKRCETLRNDFEQKSQRLTEYLNAASKVGGRDDSETVKAMRSKIADLRDEILCLEEELAGCRGEKSAGFSQGLSTVRSEEDQHATKGCDDLTRRLVVLVRAVNKFGRREHSLQSGLTSQERKEFQEATQELKTVRDALKSRCSPPSTPRPSRRGTKPSSEN